MAGENDADELRKLREDVARLQREKDEQSVKASAEAERFTKLQRETREKDVAAKRKQIFEYLEQNVKDKVILPAARERFVRRFKLETDDQAVLDMPMGDVESYVRENPNPYRKSTTVTASGNPDEIPAGGLPDRELRARAAKLCRDRGKDPKNWQELVAAGKELMRADPALAERYRSLPDDHADGKYDAA